MRQEYFELEDIIGYQRNFLKDLYLIKWLGYPESENTWETRKNIKTPSRATLRKMKILKANWIRNNQNPKTDEVTANKGQSVSQKALAVARPKAPTGGAHSRARRACDRANLLEGTLKKKRTLQEQTTFGPNEKRGNKRRKPLNQSSSRKENIQNISQNKDAAHRRKKNTSMETKVSSSTMLGNIDTTRASSRKSGCVLVTNVDPTTPPMTTTAGASPTSGESNVLFGLTDKEGLMVTLERSEKCSSFICIFKSQHTGEEVRRCNFLDFVNEDDKCALRLIWQFAKQQDPSGILEKLLNRAYIN